MGEVSVRLFYPQAARYIFSPTVTGGYRIVLNSNGLRERELPAAKPAGERWILCIGNSTTFGAGLPTAESYPKQLERLLNASGAEGSLWRVINAGGQGASVSEQIRFLKRKGLKLQPECVILGFSPTMISFAGRSGDPEDIRRSGSVNTRIVVDRAFRRILLNVHSQLYNSYLYVLLDNHVRRRLYRWGVIRDRMDARQGGIFAYAFDVPGASLEETEAAYGTFRSELARCHRLLAKHGIPLLVLGIPSRFEISKSHADNERGYDLSKIRIDSMKRVGTLCAGLGITFINLQPRLAEEREGMLECRQPWDDLYIQLDYAHLNAAGTRIAAEELTRALENLLGKQAPGGRPRQPPPRPVG